jgi:DNA-binding NarL/FixJ family response regulator
VRRGPTSSSSTRPGARTSCSLGKSLQRPKELESSRLSRPTRRTTSSHGRAGASGLLSWNAAPQQLADILRRAARGETPCSPDLAEAFLRRERDEPASAVGGDGDLTERESEIAELVARGLSNKAIASRLSIELATVKNHVHSVLEKLKVHSRGEAAAKLRLTGVDRTN